MRSNSALPTRSLSRASASTGRRRGRAAGPGTTAPSARAAPRSAMCRAQPARSAEPCDEPAAPTTGSGSVSALSRARWAASSRWLRRIRRPPGGGSTGWSTWAGGGDEALEQVAHPLAWRALAAIALQQRDALVGRHRHRRRSGQQDVDPRAQRRLDVGLRQPAAWVGDVQHHVPARREEVQLGEHVHLLAQPAHAGHVHAAEQHDVGGLVQRRQRLLGQARRGVHDDVPELRASADSSRVTSSAVTVSPAAGESVPPTT